MLILNNEFIPDFELDPNKLIKVYKVCGEGLKEEWSSPFDEATENFNLLWVYKFKCLGIHRISMDSLSKRLVKFINESNEFFRDKNEKYIDEKF